MRIRFWIVTALFLTPLLAHAQESPAKTAPAAPRNFTLDDFFQIRDVSQPELSPDGQWVAYAPFP